MIANIIGQYIISQLCHITCSGSSKIKIPRSLIRQGSDCCPSYIKSTGVLNSMPLEIRHLFSMWTHSNNCFNCVCIHVLSRAVQVHCSLFGQDILLAIIWVSHESWRRLIIKNLVTIQPIEYSFDTSPLINYTINIGQLVTTCSVYIWQTWIIGT